MLSPGDDLDMLTWEQSMNCGRNCKPLDTFTRAASFMKKKPTIVYFLSGGPTWSLTDCIKLNLADEPQMYMRPALAREEKALLRQSLKKIARNSLHMFEMQFLKDDSAQDFIFNRFAAFAPMGVSSFPIESYKCYGPYNYSYAEQSAHSHIFVKNSNGTIESIPVNPFSAAGAPWHPGKRAHQLRADALAYYMLSILADAIDGVRTISCKPYVQTPADLNGTLSDDDVSRDMNFNNNQNVHNDHRRQRHIRRRNSALQQWSELKSQLLANNSAHSLRRKLSSVTHQHLSVQDIQVALNLSFVQVNAQSVESFVHRVFNYHLSRGSRNVSQNNMQILYATALLYEYTSEYLNTNYAMKPLVAVPDTYDLSETNYIPHCYTDFEPRMANSLDSLVEHDLTTWQRNLSFFDVKGVQKAIDNHWGYLDRKYVFYSVGVNSSIYLDVSVLHTSKIWLCELQKGFLKYPNNMADLNTGASVWLHSRPSSANPLTLGKLDILYIDYLCYCVPNFFCRSYAELDLLLDQCYRSSQEVSPGKYTLQIQQKSDKVINLAYVVTW
ncbi:hypothetical protein EON65_19620 [archaeon]|nr:MAG: hypothetical protein EON65_19620 [archaeon]